MMGLGGFAKVIDWVGKSYGFVARVSSPGRLRLWTNGTDLKWTNSAGADVDVVPADPGDITGVGVTAPITGGGTSGSVTIGVDTMGAATGLSAGTRGVVPAPSAGDHVKVLWGDATYKYPQTNTIVYGSGLQVPNDPFGTSVTSGNVELPTAASTQGYVIRALSDGSTTDFWPDSGDYVKIGAETSIVGDGHTTALRLDSDAYIEMQSDGNDSWRVLTMRGGVTLFQT